MLECVSWGIQHRGEDIKSAPTHGPKNRNKGVGAVTRNECLQRARASCGSKKLCTPRADGASVLLREVVFEKRAFKLDF